MDLPKASPSDRWRLHAAVPLCCAVLALAWASSPWSSEYFDFVDRIVSLRAGVTAFRQSVPAAAAQILMPGFFLALTLSAKEAIIQARFGQTSAATKRLEAVETGLLLAVVVAALFGHWFRAGTTAGPDEALVAAALVSILLLSSGSAVPAPGLYAIVISASGIVAARASLHPAAVAIILGMFVPSWRVIDPLPFVRAVKNDLERFENAWPFQERGPSDPRQQNAIARLGDAVRLVQSPMVRIERALGPFAANVGVPIFVAANSGVRVQGGPSGPLSWRIVATAAGLLVVSKPLSKWAAVRVVRLISVTAPSTPAGSSAFVAGQSDGIRGVIALFLAVAVIDRPATRDSAILGVILGSVMLVLPMILARVRQGDDEAGIVIPLPFVRHPTDTRA